MAGFMRKSKFRHVFGQPLKRDQCYDAIQLTKTTYDRPFVAINPKFLAVIVQRVGGGPILVIPINKFGRVERDYPLIVGHKAPVLDIAWCPHNDNLLASASEDCSVMIWNIPDAGLVTNMEEPVVELKLHQRRVGLVVWHPVAANVLLSAGTDNKIFLWNAGAGEALLQIDVPDQIFSASFNFDGSKVVITCKDKKMRVINCRTGAVLSEQMPHQGTKPAQAMFLKDGRIFTSGFSRMSERQYALWSEDLKQLHMDEIDQNNGVLFLNYDPDVNLVFLAAKGDSIVRYYEITDEEPYVHFLSLFQSKEAQRGFGYQIKRGIDIKTCEIARMYKLHNSGLCEVIPFTVPRKSELFQDDLYPNTAADQAALTADEWFDGKNASPVTLSLKDKFQEMTGGAQTASKPPVRKANILDNLNTKTPQKAPPMKTEEPPAPKPAFTQQRPTPKPTPEPVVTPKPEPTPSRKSMDTNNDSSASPVSLPPKKDSSGFEVIVKALKAKVEAQEDLISELLRRVSALETAADRRDEGNDEEK